MHNDSGVLTRAPLEYIYIFIDCSITTKDIYNFTSYKIKVIIPVKDTNIKQKHVKYEKGIETKEIFD